MNNDEVMVSILCMAYNQEKYIRRCLEGFVKQKTDFAFEVIIHDDASTDGTPEIIKEFQEKYPNIIKPIFQKENQYSTGILIGKTYIYPKMSGKYMAQCDGDDYWTDEYKLQKQVDFLESHPDYALCFHPGKIIYEGCDKKPEIWPKLSYINPKYYWKLLKGNYILANSIMYRFKYIQAIYEDYPRDIYPGDWFNHINVAKFGKIGFLPDVMTIYRRNCQGISYTVSDNPVREIYLKYNYKVINFHYEVYQRVKDLYPQYFERVFLPIFEEVVSICFAEGKFDELKYIYDKYPQYMDKIESIRVEKFNSVEKKYKKYRKLYRILLLISITLTVLFTLFITFISLI